VPWLIQHKCSLAQAESEPSDYAVMRGTHNGEPITRVVCPNKDCREEFFILGTEMFNEAIPDSRPSGLPPGFVVLRSRTSS
jgi:hypothetical protein